MIAGVVLYYLVLLCRFRKKADSPLSQSPGNRKTERVVVGKTTFRLRQVKPSEDTESQVSKDVNNASIFAPADTEDTLQPMDVEFEMEYENNTTEEDLEAEEIVLITGEERQSARGVSFEEMTQAVQVVRQQEAPEEEERKALQTLSVMQQTSLYNTMMEQINGGMVRVAEMLGKYDAVFIAPPNGTSPEDLQELDMNDYM